MCRRRGGLIRFLLVVAGRASGCWSGIARCSLGLIGTIACKVRSIPGRNFEKAKRLDISQETKPVLEVFLSPFSAKPPSILLSLTHLTHLAREDIGEQGKAV